MEIVADLHLHSKYSRAVSSQMVIPQMARWAKIKGIDLLGTADWTHPLWLRELKENLREAGEGVFVYKSDPFGPKFILTTEIASIYYQNGKARRIHTLFFAPDFVAVEAFNEKLRQRGVNLMSDGRPMTGLSVRQLAEAAFSISKDFLVVPSHLWTPWYGTYGDKGGFNSLKEAYGDLAKYIWAIETGLSSDPGMNWRVKDLDEKTILSFSDAHSLQKLGREMTVLQTKNSKLKINYEDIVGAIKNDKSSNWEVGYTVEFYPEEGKYHYTGHRNCGIIQSPEETAKKGTTCPVCGKGLTVGVMERVEKLSKSTTLLRQDFAGQAGATRTDEFGVRWFEKEGRAPYVTLVPLAEIIAESLGVGEASKKVEEEYLKLINIFGSELRVLMKLRMEEIAKVAGEKLAEGIGKVRKGDIFIRPGYDGEYGKVAVWSSSAEAPGNEGEKVEQGTLF